MMRNLILISLVLLTLFCVGSVFAQGPKEKKPIEKPNFSGTWIWKSKNDYHQIIIEQNETEIILKETIQSENKPKIERESKYFTDGRGEKNEFYAGKVIESITTFHKNKIVISFISSDLQPNKKVKSGSIELSLKNVEKMILAQTDFLMKFLSEVLKQSPVNIKTFRKVI